MSKYRVVRRDVKHLGQVYSVGETFEADLPRGEAWIRAGILELVDVEDAPVKKQRRRRRKTVVETSSEE